MHTRTWVAGEWFGHEGGVHTLLKRHLFDDQTERHDVVSHRERICVSKVDLLLTRSTLMVTELDGDTHRFQDCDGLSTEVVSRTMWAVIEVANLIDRCGHLASAEALLDEEEFDFRMGIERKAKIGGLGQRALEHMPRIGIRRRAVGHQDVAEHTSYTWALATPRQHLERAGIRLDQHVGFNDASKALDRGAIETNTFSEGTFKFGGSNRNRLEHAEHIGEPQPNESNISLFDRAQHKLCLLIHGYILTQN